MSSGSASPPQTALGEFVNALEESAIALLLGLMTLVIFINVPIRYLFNGVILPRVEFLWAVEVTGFLFAWLVVFGAAYCVKTGANLGVDALINIMPKGPRRLVGLVACAFCIGYTLLLLKGSWDYWAPFANLPPTTGRWFPTGLNTTSLPQGWYEVNDIPFPHWLGFLQDWFNEGEEYEKIPRVLPYLILPVGALLLLLRFTQATIRLWRGEIDRVITSHEAEDQVAEVATQSGGR